MTSARAVLDASVILAFLFGEPGLETAKRVVPTGCLLTVNLAEVVRKLIDEGMPEFDRRGWSARSAARWCRSLRTWRSGLAIFGPRA